MIRRTSCGGPFARHYTCSKCRDARSVRPLCQRLRYQSVSTISVCFNGNGRPPTQHYPCVPTTVTRLALTGTDAQIVRPYNRYTSRYSGTDARPSVPTTVIRLVIRERTLDRASLQPLHVSLLGNGRPPARHSRASLQPLHVSLFGDGRPPA